MIEHHIQRDILIRLSKAKALRFSELKPTELESNLFMYHLGQLKAKKLLEKTEEGYGLSDAGLSYIDGFSFNTLKPRKQPKVISILAIRNDKGQWLLAKRKYQPYISQHMFVSGKQHLGESPEVHAKRELKEKLNLDVPLRRRGLSDVRIYHGQEIITHVTAHIYEGVTDNSDLPPSTHQFEFVWYEPGEHKLLAGTKQIIEKLETMPNLFFLSLDEQDE